jgi:hypothetical protein
MNDTKDQEVRRTYLGCEDIEASLRKSYKEWEGTAETAKFASHKN